MALQDPDAHIVVTVGPAGTGKTYLAMQAAVKALKEGQCERIVMTRPAVGVEGEQHGFLPGNLVAKMEPWTRPLLDVMREYYRAQDIVALIEDQVVEIAPLAFMRGRTFKNSWIIADEMQNATPAQAKMLMTRIGTNSKIVITGDVEQADRHSGDNGLLDLCERLQSMPVDRYCCLCFRSPGRSASPDHWVSVETLRSLGGDNFVDFPPIFDYRNLLVGMTHIMTMFH
jgi:phosphate starvation-inducible protein PhoH